MEGDQLVVSRVKLIMVAVLSTLALSAAWAGSAAAEWLINGAPLGEGHSAALASLPIVHSSIILHFKISETQSILVLCATVHIINGRILPPNRIFVGSLDFLNCHTIAPTPTHCELEGASLGELKLIATKPLLVLAISSTREVFKPETGKLFTELPFEETTCAIGGAVSVKGEVTGATPTGGTESADQVLEGLGEKENNSLEVGNNKGFLLGKILILLQSGSKWSFK